jgi:hypothetical protein
LGRIDEGLEAGELDLGQPHLVLLPPLRSGVEKMV